MIKLFRRIRQQFLLQNSVSKYLLYAIGEILLVVIGILIALQVNNANEIGQRKLLERELLKQVRQDILTVNNDLETDLDRLLLGQSSYFRIKKYIKENLEYADSMCFDFQWLIIDEYIFPKTATFNRIQEEGIDIIRNDSIKSALISLFESHFIRISLDRQFHPNIAKYFDDYYRKNFKPNEDFKLEYFNVVGSDTLRFPVSFELDGKKGMYTRGFVPLDFEKLKKDSEFKMMLNRSQVFRRYKIRRYQRAKHVIQMVIPLIDKELLND